MKAAIDGDKNSAWAIDPEFGKNHAAVFELEKPIGFEGGTELSFTLEFNNNTGHGIGRPRLAVSTLPAPVALDGEALPAGVQQALGRLDATRKAVLTPAERETLLAWYRTLRRRLASPESQGGRTSENGTGAGESESADLQRRAAAAAAAHPGRRLP